MRNLVVAATLLSAAIFAAPASADSDGYFCIGPNYIAYQLNNPGIPGAHKLYVIPFNGGNIKIHRSEATLPDFQVHRLSCESQHIRLVGWNSIHDVVWAGLIPTRFSISETAKESGPPQHGSEPRNLIFESPFKEAIEIPSTLNSLVLTSRKKDIPELKCTELVTVYLELHQWDSIVNSLILVSRDKPKECG